VRTCSFITAPFYREETNKILALVSEIRTRSRRWKGKVRGQALSLRRFSLQLVRNSIRGNDGRGGITGERKFNFRVYCWRNSDFPRDKSEEQRAHPEHISERTAHAISWSAHGAHRECTFQHGANREVRGVSRLAIVSLPRHRERQRQRRGRGRGRLIKHAFAIHA